MLKIKLRRTGKRGYASYQIIVNEARSKRDGRYLEQLGIYDPNTKPLSIKIDKKRLSYWQEKGAQPTEPVRRLIKKYA